MENKDKYLKALMENDGRMNEIDLGESIGFTEGQTTRLIVQLLAEYKIEFESNRACSYRIKMRKRN